VLLRAIRNLPESSHMFLRFALTVVLVLTALPALAQEACHLSYMQFEDEVPHLDALACPDGKPAAEEGFCRYGIDEDEITIYRFAYRGDDSCMTAADTMDIGDFLERFGVTIAE